MSNAMVRVVPHFASSTRTCGGQYHLKHDYFEKIIGSRKPDHFFLCAQGPEPNVVDFSSITYFNRYSQLLTRRARPVRKYCLRRQKSAHPYVPWDEFKARVVVCTPNRTRLESGACCLSNVFYGRGNRFPLKRFLNDGVSQPEIVGMPISFRKMTLLFTRTMGIIHRDAI